MLGHHPRDPVTSEALHYIGRVVNPAADISLRTIDPERFIIYNTADNCVLEEIEANMAFYEIYDGAIYLYQVRQGAVDLCVGEAAGVALAFDSRNFIITGPIRTGSVGPAALEELHWH